MIKNLSQMPYKMKGLSPERCMSLLMGNYSGPSVIVPNPNKYYTFVYVAKTPNIQYDQHPLILCGDVFQWGFTGFNFHWEQIRRYTWQECRSNLLEISEQEFETVKSLPTARFK